jgi:uncharacterized coiled-coil protein SlyX
MKYKTSKSFISDSAIRTFFKGFLGAATFEAYNQFNIIEPMKKTIKKQNADIKNLESINAEQAHTIHDLNMMLTSQQQIIKRLETKINRWW